MTLKNSRKTPKEILGSEIVSKKEDEVSHFKSSELKPLIPGRIVGSLDTADAELRNYLAIW